MNPYYPFVAAVSELADSAKKLPLGNIPPHQHPRPAADAPKVLVFSPHPDDECLIGGLALRLMRESGRRVVNVAVTQGSNPARQQPRLEELRNACDWIGFELQTTVPNGLQGINPKTRAGCPEQWAAAVKCIAGLLLQHRPEAILFPHQLDWNSTHVGTHYLVMDALRSLPADFSCFLVETEFWGQMADPNLMVESSVADVADLIAALSFHVEEVRRNPYHLRMPAWMQDNVRRGAELVGGQGGAAPEFLLATLYKFSRWEHGKAQSTWTGGRQIGVHDDPAKLLGLPVDAAKPV